MTAVEGRIDVETWTRNNCNSQRQLDMSIGTYLSRKSSLKWWKSVQVLVSSIPIGIELRSGKARQLILKAAEHYSTVDSLSIHPPQCARLAAGCVGRWRVAVGPKTGTARLGVRWPDYQWNAWQWTYSKLAICESQLESDWSFLCARTTCQVEIAAPAPKSVRSWN